MTPEKAAASSTTSSNVSWTRSDWLGIVGIMIGALGIGLAYYFYIDTKAIREPVFLIDPVKTEIIGSAHLKEAPIRVIGKDGREIKSDLTSIRFYFWNNGNTAIHKGNILEALRISIEDPNAKIIDFRILKISRPVTRFSLTRIAKSNELGIDFDILEQNDGATAQLIYEGNPNSQVRIAGTIESSQIRTSVESLTNWSALKTAIQSFIFLALGIFTGVYVKMPFDDFISKLFERFMKLLPTSVGCIIVLIMLVGSVGIIGLIIADAIKNVRDSSRPQSIVPSTLRIAPSKL